MKIKFLVDAIYETKGPGKGPAFSAGQVLDAADVPEALGLKDKPTVEWVEGFLRRWISRGVAELVPQKAKRQAPAAASSSPAGQVAPPEAQDGPAADPPPAPPTSALAAPGGTAVGQD